MTPIRGLDPCGCRVDPIRYEYVGAVRPYIDHPDVVVPVRWYRAAPSAQPLGHVTAFGDSFYVNNPTFVPRNGMDRAFDATFLGNPGGYLGVRPCGDATAWKNGVRLDDPPPPCNCAREAVVPVQEIPAGLVDGVNRVFLVAQIPISAASVLIFVNGVEQAQLVNYSLSSQTIFFTPVSTPTVGSNVVAYYWVAT